MRIVGGLLAHRGGWDEALFVLLPVALFGGLLTIANRRAQNAERAEQGDRADPPPEPGPSTGTPEGPAG